MGLQLTWSQTTAENIDTVFDKGLMFHYVNKDSTYFYYEKVITLAKKQNDIESLLVALSYLINANNNYYDLENYGRNILRVDSLIQKNPSIDSLPMGRSFKDNLIFDKGSYYYNLKNYSTAQKYFSQYYTKLKAISVNDLAAFDIDMMSAIYSYLGLIHGHTGKYEQAEFYFKKDIAWVNTYKDSLEEWQSTLYNTKKLLSQVYEVQNKPASANKLLVEALEFYDSQKHNPQYKNNFISTGILLAKNHIAQDDFGSAITVLNQNQLEAVEDNPFLKEIEVIYGDAFLGMKNYTQAQRYYENALRNYQAYRQSSRHQDVAMAHGKIAELYLYKANYEAGMQSILSALNSSGAEIRLNAMDENPNPENVFSKRQLLQLLDIKLQLLMQAYEKTQDISYLNNALKTNKYVLLTFDLLKKEYDSKIDKRFLAESVYPIFHRMMEVTFISYQKNNSKEVLQLAIDITENNKDFLLLEALRNASATEYGEVPKALIDKEAQLRSKITYLEKEIFNKTDSKDEFSNQLFKLKQEYYSFLDTLKLKHPNYHDLKYGGKKLDIETLRNTLIDEENTIVSYTIGEAFLYTIVLNKSKERFLKIPFTEEDRADVRTFYKLLSKPTISLWNTDISVIGKRLFDKILKDPLLNFEAKNLTIIPDDVLHYLPFDMLIENESYLLNEKAISYGNSLTSLFELKEKNSSQNNRLLAFAPEFEGAVAQSSKTQTRQFGKLIYNDDEVISISNFFETDIFIDAKATLEAFKNEASKANIVHLATHASANDEFPDYSYLAFSETNRFEEEQILYIKDLYNMKWDIDMVVLSACQTGIGKLQQGQGMLSLSKGFYYAGAKSLVHTQWKINDKSTVKLMDYFYEALSTGATKSEALRTPN